MMRQIHESELEYMYRLETTSFPPGVADSWETMQSRLQEAGGLNVGYYTDDQLVGFISGSRYNGDNYTRECMKTHVPNGRNICIHSVVVDKQHRGQGIASTMLKNYIETVHVEQGQVEKILMVSQSHLIPLYTRLGFVVRGVSDIVLGFTPVQQQGHIHGADGSTGSNPPFSLYGRGVASMIG